MSWFLTTVDTASRGPAWQEAMTWLLSRLLKKKLTEGGATIDSNYPIEYRDNLQSAYNTKRSHLKKETCQEMYDEVLGKLPRSYHEAWEAVLQEHTAAVIEQSVTRKLNRESSKKRKR